VTARTMRMAKRRSVSGRKADGAWPPAASEGHKSLGGQGQTAGPTTTDGRSISYASRQPYPTGAWNAEAGAFAPGSSNAQR
jgi:hypothetical protein